MSAIVVIPSRMASTRLPGKPLEIIGGEPMIVQVWRRAVEADVGRVVVAAADRVILDAVDRAGGEGVMTDRDLASGSDRVYQALGRIDGEHRHDVVLLNLQGDLPTLEPSAMRLAVAALAETGADIATLVAQTTDDGECSDPNVVKAVVSWRDGGKTGRALYFTRAQAPWGVGPLWHHVGLYGWRREALGRFVSLPVSDLESREKLEQLRALEAGMTIAVARIDSVPVGVDTPADLERARSFFSEMPAS